MLVLISYDVNTEDGAGKRRLRRIAKLCADWGQRVQFSVFECLLDNAQWQRLRARLLDEMDPQRDSLRFYFLGKQWHTKIEHIGIKAAYDPEGPLIF
ncbi:CRISPR-associated endonuclease Cas2 [uncultured Desulfovibrio sp.]|uniref:CRISPR-associated endonuclease Cas2 n=1 Tax=uncultured Desulfovibrio sp. TaxID=167968 RepID=UPI0026256FE4|nr:CRISPR-associated endonuclease Cas2 [uncultured Desulfovibrio sp.]